MRGFDGLTFVTNSTNVAVELQKNGWSNIILSGGNFRTPSDALVGPLAEHAIRSLYSDVLFLGAHAVDVRAGMSTPNILEAAVDQALIENSHRVVLVVDHYKCGTRSLAHIAGLSAVDLVVTDDGGGEEHIRRIREIGVPVQVARLDSASASAT
jgi:DeoR/GlpR family transcriptional regulator of sugar metabolism